MLPADAAFVPKYRQRILIVSDGRTDIGGLRLAFSHPSYELVDAIGTDRAADMVQAAAPDLILLELHDPSGPIIDFCARLKRQQSTHRIPIVVVSAEDSPGQHLKAVEAGADEFLLKPFDQRVATSRLMWLLEAKGRAERLETAEDALLALVRAVEARDIYTHAHSERTASYAVELGRAVMLPEETLELLKRAGRLHDIGKIGIPDSILLKPGPLTKSEYRGIQRHSIIGETIAAPLKANDFVRFLIRHHHERVDGQGYPDGLMGQDFCMEARILAIADAFDSMTSERVYRTAMLPEAAFAVLRDGSGRQWDAHLVDIFIEVTRQRLSEESAASAASLSRGNLAAG